LSNLETLVRFVENNETVLDIVSDLTESKTLNSDETIEGSKSIIDKVISLDNEESILSPEMANLTSDIMQNFLSYFGENDCSLGSNLTHAVEADF